MELITVTPANNEGITEGVVLKKYLVRVLNISEWETNVSLLVDVYAVRTPVVLDQDGDWALQPFTHKIKSNVYLPYGHPMLDMIQKGTDLEVRATSLSAQPKSKPLVDRRDGSETLIYPFLYVDIDSIEVVSVNPLIYGGVDHSVSTKVAPSTKLRQSNKKGPGLASRLWNALFPKD